MALDVSQQQVAEAQRSSLKWVLPHALEIEAAARIGLRDFDGALRALARARRMAIEHGNIHTQLNSLVLTARVHLAQGAPDRAIEVLSGKRGRSSSPGMEGDYLSTKGFAFACCSRNEEAESALVASEVTDHVDARVLRAFARAIMKHIVDRASRDAKQLLGVAFEEARSTGNYDSFVCAYRAVPSVLLSLGDFSDAKSRRFWSVVEAVDSRLAVTLGVGPSKAKRTLSPGRLTPREQEVLRLLRQGLSNRQIARTLWIAESTVKVHVHHVLEKLGARSRTEAAALSQDDL
jgi:DNA-binding CsgD family transcriptional regulator